MARWVLSDLTADRLRELLSSHAGPRPGVAEGGARRHAQHVRVSGPESEDMPGWWPCAPCDYATGDAVFDEGEAGEESGMVYSPNGPLAEGDICTAIPAADIVGGDAATLVWVTDGGLSDPPAGSETTHEETTDEYVDATVNIDGDTEINLAGPTVNVTASTVVVVATGQTLNFTGVVLFNGLQADTSRRAFTQTAHGLAVGDAVYYDGVDWDWADASDGEMLSIGIICAVADANNFTVQFSGYITGLAGLVPGQYYFVSDDDPGELTDVEPEYPAWSNPILFAFTATTGCVLPWRPSREATGAAATALQARLNAALGAAGLAAAGGVAVSGSLAATLGAATLAGTGTASSAPTSPWTITSSGTYAIPAADFTVVAIGGGGGGGGGDGAGGGGGGGGGGVWTTKAMTGTTPGDPLTVTIGAGGGSLGAGLGGVGGGTTTVMMGASTLVSSGGGDPGVGSGAGGFGGSGGTSPTTGDSNNTGGSGGNGGYTGSYAVGGGGGAGGSTGGGGTGGSGAAPSVGGGGNSPGGTGGVGDSTGGVGVVPGGGGGGSLGNVGGGSGADGRVIITW